MSKRFTENVSLILEKKSKATLRILLEEDEDEAKSDSDTGDIFDMGPEDDESESPEETTGSAEEPSTPTKEPAEATETPAGSVGEPSKNKESSDDEVEQDIDYIKDASNKTAEYLENMNTSIKIDSSNEAISNIASYISNFVESTTYKNISMKDFLFEEDKTKLEKSLEAYQDTLEKTKSYIDNYKLGKTVDIASYVDGAVSALEKFDNLFTKESFIIQAVVNLLVLNTGSKASDYIEEFKDLFAKRLDKKGISYDSRVIRNTGYKVAVGGKSQG